jgi:hypothetical protein
VNLGSTGWIVERERRRNTRSGKSATIDSIDVVLEFKMGEEWVNLQL